MQIHVENYHLHVGDIRILGISASSVLLIGDNEVITCSSVFDTPPESLIVTPLVPFAPEGESSE